MPNPQREVSPSGQASSGNANPPSRTVEGFALTGASDLPDPATHAFRKDLADTALAGRVIASHYADPLSRTLASGADFHAEPDDASEKLAALAAGDVLRILDNSRGWAWGYAPDGRVGYVPSAALA